MARYEPEPDPGGPVDAEEELPRAVSALEAEPPDPPQEAITRFIPAAEPVLIAGPSGVFKTAVALVIAASKTSGSDLFGHPDFQVTSPGPVLFISEEDGLAVLLNRLEAIIKGHGLDRERVLSNVYFLAQEGVSLDRPEWRDHILEEMKRVGAQLLGGPRPTVIVDAGGLGWGLVDMLRERGWHVIAFQAATQARDVERYSNARSEAAWLAREALQVGRLPLPDDPELLEELLAHTWSLDSAGRIALDPKAEIVKRIKAGSPDKADSVFLLAWHIRPASPVLASVDLSVNSELVQVPGWRSDDEAWTSARIY